MQEVKTSVFTESQVVLIERSLPLRSNSMLRYGIMHSSHFNSSWLKSCTEILLLRLNACVGSTGSIQIWATEISSLRSTCSVNIQMNLLCISAIPSTSPSGSTHVHLLPLVVQTLFFPCTEPVHIDSCHKLSVEIEDSFIFFPDWGNNRKSWNLNAGLI